MKVLIQTLTQEKHELEVEANHTIGSVKGQVEEKLKLGAVAAQHLIFNGKILKNDKTLEESKVKDNDTLVVMIKKKKQRTAAPAAAPAASPAPAPAPAPAAAPATPATPAAAASVPMDESKTETPTPATPAAATAATPATPATPAAAAVPAAGAAAAASPDVQSAASNLVVGEQAQEMVANLMNLGFSNEQVTAALRAAFNNPDRAADYLFNGIPAHLQAQAAGQAPPAAAAAAAAASPEAAAGAEAGAAAGGDGGEGVAPMDMSGIAEAAAGNPMLAQMAGAGGGGPNMDAIRQQIQANPQMIPLLLQSLQQSHPQLVQQLRQNPQMLMQMLRGMGGAGGAGGGDPAAAGGAPAGMPQMPPGAHAIQVTEEERVSISNLEALGFSRQMAIEAFLVCGKDEQMAANYLFDNM